MKLRAPGSTRTGTLFPYTTLFRSIGTVGGQLQLPGAAPGAHQLAAEVLQQQGDSAAEILGLAHRLGEDLPREESGRRLARRERFRLRPQRLGEAAHRSEEHTSELQSLMRISYAVFCLKKKTKQQKQDTHKH